MCISLSCIVVCMGEPGVGYRGLEREVYNTSTLLLLLLLLLVVVLIIISVCGGGVSDV